MLDFNSWLKENGMRTSLGPYPPAYGADNYPPEYFAPIAADWKRKLDTFHDGGVDTDAPKPKKKKAKDTAKKGKKKK
jgi:hypothetical protein